MDISEHSPVKIKGETLSELPQDLYIPPDALEVYLDTFEGPLDLLLYLIRKHNLDILDIQMARLTTQYMAYVDKMKAIKLELAADYLLMAAMLIEIKSRMLLPKPTEEIDVAAAYYEHISQVKPPEVSLDDLVEAWRNVLKRAKLTQHHKLGRAELSVREHMSLLLRRLSTATVLRFDELFDLETDGIPKLVVSFLAMLELAKEGLIRITQQEAFGVIYVQAYSEGAS